MWDSSIFKCLSLWPNQSFWCGFILSMRLTMYISTAYGDPSRPLSSITVLIFLFVLLWRPKFFGSPIDFGIKPSLQHTCCTLMLVVLQPWPSLYSMRAVALFYYFFLGSGAPCVCVVIPLGCENMCDWCQFLQSHLSWDGSGMLGPWQPLMVHVTL